MKKSNEVYNCIGTGLGDVLGGLMLYHRWSIEQNVIIRVSTWYPRGAKRKDYAGKAHELLPLIDSPGQVELTDEAPTSCHPPAEGIANPFYPSVVRWCPSDSKTVCYQFDGKSHKEKNFTSFEDWGEIAGFLCGLGYEPVRLGNHLSLQECMDLLAGSAAFVGVPSGMGVLNFAVGAPHFMIRNGLGAEWLKTVMYGPFMLMRDKWQFQRLFGLFHENGYEFFRKWCLHPELCRF